MGSENGDVIGGVLALFTGTEGAFATDVPVGNAEDEDDEVDDDDVVHVYQECQHSNRP